MAPRVQLGHGVGDASSSVGLSQTRGITGQCPEAARGGRGGITTWLLCSRLNGQCQDMEVVLQKTSEPGKYTACESWSPSQAALPTHWERGAPGTMPGRASSLRSLLLSDPLILLSPLMSQNALQIRTRALKL